jgi:hypothetical protein
VFVGRIGETEIDFITEKDGSRMYIQVARSILDEGTAEREFRPLMLVNDNYPKYILTLDMMDLSRSGIRHLSAERFLAGTDTI